MSKSMIDFIGQDQDGNSSKPLLCDGLMTEDLIIKMSKKHLIMLYDFAYKLAKKSGSRKVDKLKEIDLLINSVSYE